MKPTAQQKEETEALHVQDGDTHLIGVKALHVMLLQDGSGWFAQGLEIDYAAGGKTIAMAKKNFSTGLKKTIHEHLVMHGKIDYLLKLAPQAAWDQYLKAPPDTLKAGYTTVQIHCLSPNNKKNILPFEEIQFIERQQEAFAA